MAELVDWAAVSRHLEQRLGVPPLIRLNGKAPLDSGWPTGPRRKPSEWRRRLAGHSGNVGMLTGGELVVVDVDLHHPEGAESFDRLRALGLPTETVTAITGGGGRHYFYRCPFPIRSGPLAGFPGIDIKGEGGQVVAVGSTHPVTRALYEWEYGWSPDDLEPLVLPEAILALLAAGGATDAVHELDERTEAAVSLLLDHLGGHDPVVHPTYVEVTRPGKEARAGGSASVGVLGPGVTKVWSTNWEGLPAAVYSLTELRRLAGVPGPKLNVPGIAPPSGYRWWQRGDDERAIPTLGAEAYLGPVGEFLELVAGETEGHPAPIGFTVLVYLGGWLGRRHRVVLGGISHASNLWAIAVGDTSTGAKGTSSGTGRRLLNVVDPTLVARLSVSGFGSGQVVVDTVRDRDDGEGRKEIVITDAEMAHVLRTCAMKESTLSETLRKAFDGDPLEWRTIGHGRIVATDHHICVIGAITPDELRVMLDETAIRNGLGNRFLYLWSQSADPLPFGGNVDAVRLAGIADTIGERLEGDIFERTYEVRQGSAFGELWRPWYLEHCNGVDAGVVKILTARMRVHLPRIAAVYAALDGAGALGPEHFEAAKAWTDYGTDTVRLVFGEGVVGHARKLLEAIRTAGRDGLDGTAQRDLFSRNLSGDELAALRAELEGRGLIWTVHVPTGGAPKLLSFAMSRSS